MIGPVRDVCSLMLKEFLRNRANPKGFKTIIRNPISTFYRVSTVLFPLLSFSFFFFRKFLFFFFFPPERFYSLFAVLNSE